MISNHAHTPAGLQVRVEVLLPDLPEVGSVPGAHQDAPGAADLPLPPLQQGVPLALRTGSPPVLALLLPTAEHAQGNHRLQVSATASLNQQCSDPSDAQRPT